MLSRLITLSVVAIWPFSVVAQTVTRFEQDDPRITYTGTWYPSTNALESGGSSVLANLKGSQAVVVFNGTGITWIGESDGYSGYCYLTLDGVQTTVDTGSTSGTTLYQQSLFAVHGLAPGLHRMTIEITHSHDESTDASWIWVDAFDVDNGTLVSTTQTTGAGLAEDTTIAANYSGHWFNTTGSLYSGGSINSAVDAGAGVTFTFNGTAVTWIGYRDQWSGIAQVYIDGNPQATVDTYLSPSQAQTPTWSVNGLSPGIHVLNITATGTEDAVSGGAWVWVNAFQVSGSVTPQPLTFSSGGVVSAASFMPTPGNQVTAGQIVSLFGQNFTASAGVSATSVPLPTTLAPENVSVTACGVAVPLYSVSPGQINAQLPVACGNSGTANATITSSGQTATQSFTLAQASPGIFTINGSGTGDGVILHANNTLVSAANPAIAGEEVVIYATGLGPTSPSFATGTGANQTNTTVMPITVTVGGQNAAVVYSGLTQGLVGLYQVNAVMPSGLTGSQPVVITLGTAYSSRAGVTMSLQ
jgi:uncharacterized protein (TIGR03437 family)